MWLFVCWGAFFALTAPFFFVFYDRYIYQLIPIQVILTASILLRFPMPKIDRIAALLTQIIYVLFVLLWLVSVALFYFRWEVWIGFALNTALLLLYTRFKSPEASFEVHRKASIFILGIFLNLGVILLPVVNPEVEKKAADYLISQKTEFTNVIYFAEKRDAAKLRIAADGRFHVRRIETWEEIAKLPPKILLLVKSKQMESLQKSSIQFEAKPIALKYEDLLSYDFVAERIKKRDQIYWVILK
ncbi:MAG: hypothetical protein AAF740_12145 [Bacteroidota bacterium]